MQASVKFDFVFEFTARQDYFTHFEPSPSLDGAKTDDPREKLPNHPQAERGLSHMWRELGSNPYTCRIDYKQCKISVLNHSATKIAYCLI